MNLTHGRKVFLASKPVDFRKQHAGLAALVFQYFPASLVDGHYFVFTNKRRNRLKILYYHSGALVLVYKRLEKGSFPWPSQSNSAVTLEISSAQMEELFSPKPSLSLT